MDVLPTLLLSHKLCVHIWEIDFASPSQQVCYNETQVYFQCVGSIVQAPTASPGPQEAMQAEAMGPFVR